MPFKIPESHEKPIATLTHLTPDAREALIGALRAMRPMLSSSRLIAQIAPLVPIEPSELPGIISVIFSLYSVREHYQLPLDQLLEEIIVSVQEQGVAELADPEQRHQFSELLRDLLSLEHTIGVTAKANDVLTQHTNVFTAARIISDIRPVFASSDQPTIAAALIVHNLKISAAVSGELPDKEIFFALDSKDLRNLQDVITRAIRKEEELQAFAGRSGLPYIEIE